LHKLIELYPEDVSSDNARKLLAEACHGLNETNIEREVLSGLAALDADDLDTFLRLAEMCSTVEDWSCAAQNAERFLAVNPLLGEPYRYLASASEALDQSQPAIQSYQTLLLLDPVDPAEAHFRLARLLHQAGDAAAKRHVLQALEEAPRFRDAHKLLLEISGDSKPNAEKTPTEEEKKP
jgi:tetratricopeptide (TPR) repeat protein